MIYALFGVDIVNDDSSVHPPKKICDECYQYLMNSYKTGTQGEYCHEMNLDGVFGTLKDSLRCKTLVPCGKYILTLAVQYVDCTNLKSKQECQRTIRREDLLSFCLTFHHPIYFIISFLRIPLSVESNQTVLLSFLRYKRRSLFVPSVY